VTGVSAETSAADTDVADIDNASKAAEAKVRGFFIPVSPIPVI
jgi:hypothetical protein